MTKKLTLNELAEKYKISAERIRQIEATAFKKLKTSLVKCLKLGYYLTERS